jgi:exopolysaccharide biosynthesis polyprenyl glycosylphosphotransferase
VVVSTVQETAVPERRSRRRWIGRRPTRAGVLMAADWLIALLVSAAVFPAAEVVRAILVVPLAWIATTGVYNLYERRHLGPGSEEVRRVLRAAFAATAVACAVCALFLHRDRDVRSVLLVIPITAGVSIIVRRTVHSLARSRADDVVHRALVVGPLPQALQLAKALGRDASGLRAVALFPTAEEDADVSDAAPAILDVLGDPPDWERLATAARQTGCDSVIVIPGPHLTPASLSGLGWRLGQQGTELIVAPFVSEIATSRLAVRNNGGVPLLHVKAPDVSRISRLPKEIVERLSAAVVLLLMSPVMAGIAIAILATDGRPVLFRQRRVGQNAEEFTMLKFRTMVRNADQVKAGLAHLNLNSDGVLFKMKSDPRITRVGGVLRRYSLDELPQLFNVVGGTMSLVGPRPPLPDEVAKYTDEVRRRLLVKPGLTGLWQVSGRSDLPWEEAVRLDLSYVENWSLGLDAVILLKTPTATVKGTGAY